MALDLKNHPGRRIGAFMSIVLGAWVAFAGTYAGFIRAYSPTLAGYVGSGIVIATGIGLIAFGVTFYRGLFRRPHRLSVTADGILLTDWVSHPEWAVHWNDRDFLIKLWDLRSIRGVEGNPRKVQFLLNLDPTGFFGGTSLPIPQLAYEAVLREAERHSMHMVPSQVFDLDVITIRPSRGL